MDYNVNGVSYIHHPPKPAVNWQNASGNYRIDYITELDKTLHIVNKNLMRYENGFNYIYALKLPPFSSNAYLLRCKVDCKNRQIGVKRSYEGIVSNISYPLPRYVKIFTDKVKMSNPESDKDYLKMFGRQAAVALEYSSLFNEIEKNNNALKAAQKTLLDLKSLAIIGEMSSSMAHNLRNFIVPIAGFANRLVKVSKDETIKNYAQIIASEVENLENYLRRNLSFAKSINLEVDNIKIDDMLKYLTILANEYIKKSGKNIKFYTSKITKEEVVKWDYDRMNEVIFNIIINAIEAINEDDKDSIISVIFADNAYRESMIDIIVENTNSYIEPELAEKIFTPFFTTKSHGVGIGLAISKRIVEAHGGSMMIKSVNDTIKITTFFLSIPVSLNN